MKLALTILFMLISIILMVIILMQEGKNDGLSGAIGGASGSDTYWSKNKGRSKEAVMVTITIVLAVLFYLVAIAMNLFF